MQLNFRKSQIAALKHILRKYEDEWFLCQQKENGVPKHIAYLQLMLIYSAIDNILNNIESWVADKQCISVMSYWPSNNYIKPQGRGVYCIIGSYNFSLQSCFLPMIYAIASGNCVLVKPSNDAPLTSEFLKKIIMEGFDPRFFK